MKKQSPYLIKRRVIDKGKLWGVIAENQSKQYKISIADLLKLLIVDNRVVLVDSPHKDKPAMLVVIRGPEQDAIYYFRTLHDKYEWNNFNKVPAIKLISANKIKVLK